MLCGLDVLRQNSKLSAKWGRCALVSNQASLTFDFIPAWKVLHDQLGPRLTCLFGPQHGFESTVQDNMIETGHGTHGPTGLPVYSLYSETREPTAGMLNNVDTIVFDLQVTGCRIYTYKYTLSGCLRAAKKLGKRVVVLDRPNPLRGDIVEGNVLETTTRSFVGEFPIPMRHGLTMGEAAHFFNADIGAELDIVKLVDWNPRDYWTQYSRQWVLTSPNLPSLDACLVFPGMVLFEGTNTSEGRGTTLPFQFIGAPYIKDSEAFTKRVNELCGEEYLPGILLRPTCFQPAFQKWTNQVCNGLQVHVIKPTPFASYRLGLATLRAAIEFGGNAFKWRQPPYEYEEKLLPIQILMGSESLYKALTESSVDLDADQWSANLDSYINNVRPHLLYQREMRRISDLV